MKNLQVRIRKAFDGAPDPTDFELIETEAPTPGKGEILCRSRWLSLDSALDRLHAGEGPPVRPAHVMPARAICEVIESRNEIFNTGDVVVMEAGMQHYCVSDGVHVHRARTGSAPISTALGVMGIPGLAAYCGLLDLAQIKPGETVLISGAAGPVGSMAGQIARIKACKVIGIAGNREESSWCVKEAHFNSCINHRGEPLEQRLRQVAPKGVDVYFDTVDGAVLDAVMTGKHLALNGRIVLGAPISRYGEAAPALNLQPLVGAHARVLPLVVQDHEHRRDTFLKDAIAWFAEGHLRYREDIVDGLSNAPAQLCKLARGEGFGKSLVKT
ncbi:MAG TPA: NADP-dependent oxidoreductase [Steroidobacteraceae bacterium]|nr:NADP-dependent oxidoreductase [Steroidobacteraceae bacterium]